MDRRTQSLIEVLFAPKNLILSLYNNENLKREDRKKTTQKTSCPYAKIKKGDRRKKKPILSLYANENLKKGDRKRIQKEKNKIK
jgi:hypothetical protein